MMIVLYELYHLDELRMILNQEDFHLKRLIVQDLSQWQLLNEIKG